MNLHRKLMELITKFSRVAENKMNTQKSIAFYISNKQKMKIFRISFIMP